MAEAMDTGSRPQEAASVTRRAVYLYADSKVPDSRWGLALSRGRNSQRHFLSWGAASAGSGKVRAQWLCGKRCKAAAAGPL